MSEACHVCGESLGEPIFCSPTATSLTSHCEIRPGRTNVYFCSRCTHLQSPPQVDLDTFYAAEYNILTASEAEDQLYEHRDGRPVYRTQHQIRTLLSKAPPATNAKVLDFGCGKGAATKELLAHRPDIAAYLFEVSEVYYRFWKNFLPAERCRTFEIPADWSHRFDLVMSFFVLEHVVNLTALLDSVARVLVEGGVFYFVVPNVWVNPADFVVADHVQHYSEASLRTLLTGHGFHEVAIDSAAHQSAFVVVARKGNRERPMVEFPTADFRELSSASARELADYWASIGIRVNQFKRSFADSANSAIYGSGFYGAYLYSCLELPRNVVCFVDRNPHRQDQLLFDKPIVDPCRLPGDVELVYVGLNPCGARNAIAEVDAWKERNLQFFFL